MIDLIVGARPNFMKIASIIDAIQKVNEESLKYRLIHTGQHFDKNMSQDFLDQLKIPKPDFDLNAGGGSQAEQTAKIMIRYEKILNGNLPKLCLVVGDVTSTMACTIVAKKANLKVGHVEAGIRSNDLTMPEEINRMVTDSISDYFYTTSRGASKNLSLIGVPTEKIIFVGNTMIDTLIRFETSLLKPKVWNKIGLKKNKYIVITMHRPSNVDSILNIKKLFRTLVKYSRGLEIIFPCHPRTKKHLEKQDLDFPNLHLIDPMPYLEFNFLVKNCKAVVTDSGGITEETTFLGIPCITLRENTERPETVEIGTNELIGVNPSSLKPALNKLFEGKWKKGKIPELWDGKSGVRIVNHIISEFLDKI